MRATLAALTLAIAVLVPTAAQAATLTVETTADVSAGECTLRDAIVAANTDTAEGGCPAGAGPDRIEFSLPPESTIVLGSRLPAITSEVEIFGEGFEEVAVSGNELVGAFDISGGGDVSISGLGVIDTRCAFGCAIYNQGSLKLTEVLLTDNEAVVQGGANAFPTGGAIYNNGSLEIVESDLTDNFARATAATAQNSPEGGAITNNSSGEVTIIRSTLANNEVIAVAGAGGTTNANGGAIANFGKLTVRASTLSGNSASGSDSVSSNRGNGGAIANANSLTVAVTIERSTIAGNSASASSPVSSVGGGGITASGGSFHISSSTIAGNSAAVGSNLYLATPTNVRSTIVADPLGGGESCSGIPISQGFNLEEDDSCGFDQATDQSNVDPLLATGFLSDNGGPTPTIALQAGSPAIDHGLSAAGETADQRQFQRPVDIASVPNAPGGDGTDTGAFEVQVPDATILAGPAQGATIAEAEPSFTFDADEAGASFQCSLDGAAALPCMSPHKLPALSEGPHTFSVVAVGPLEYAGPPAIRTFTVDAVRDPGNPGGGGGGGTGGGTGGGQQPAVAPQTTLSALPARTGKRRLRIRFSSSLAGSTFSCKLDGKPWRSCRSPFRTPKLSYGRHTFRVRATSAAGTPDPTPAKKTFRVLRPERR